MKFEISFERVYPHPPAEVWPLLVDPAALGTWLMKTDFAPQIGRDFKMWCDDGAGGTDTYLCNVLEYEPPKRMLWSWILDGSQNLGETFVEFQLEPVSGGTRLTITHSGDRDADTIERFKSGWPVKLDTIETLLASNPSN